MTSRMGAEFRFCSHTHSWGAFHSKLYSYRYWETYPQSLFCTPAFPSWSHIWVPSEWPWVRFWPLDCRSASSCLWCVWCYPGFIIIIAFHLFWKYDHILAEFNIWANSVSEFVDVIGRINEHIPVCALKARLESLNCIGGPLFYRYHFGFNALHNRPVLR